MKISSITFRNLKTRDSTKIWELVSKCKSLDLNSSYLYLLLCLHFSETCLLAENDHDVVGFVSSYIPPGKNDVLFIWQIAVDPKERGQGLGKHLLQELLKLQNLSHIKYVTYTISPSNKVSKNLFSSLARELNAELKENVLLDQKLFPEEHNHEEEVLFSIGPLK